MISFLKKKKVNPRFRFAIFILALLVAVLAFLKMPDTDTLKYLCSGYSFMGIGEIEKSGDYLFVFDNGRKTLLVLNDDMEGEVLLNGGESDADFFYATHASTAGKNCWYVSDLLYGDEGTKIVKERIQKVTSSSYMGRCEWTNVYEWDYSEEAEAPKQNGYIIGLEAEGDGVTVLFKRGEKLELGFVSSDGIYSEKYVYTFDEKIYNAVFNDTGELISVNTMDGKAFVVDMAENRIIPVKINNDNALPMSSAFLGNKLYIAECVGREILCADLSTLSDGALSAESFYSDGCTYMEISSDERTGNLYITDQAAVYTMYPDGSIEMTDKVTTRYITASIIIIGILILAVVASLIIIVLSIIRFAKAYKVRVSSQKVFTYIMIVLASISVGIVVSVTLLTDLNTNSKNTVLKEMKVLAGIIKNDVDGDFIKTIDSPAAFVSDDYSNLKKQLDEVIDACYSVGSYYYYTLFAANEERDCIFGLMDYEGANTSWVPAYEYEGTEYAYVLETGEDVENRGEISAYGSYIYVDTPILDSNGEVIAVFELGMDADRLNREMRESIKEMLINIITMSCVIVMLFIELMFAYDYFAIKKVGGDEAIVYEGISVPVRFVVFLSYMAMGLQDAFIVLYSARLYENASGWLADVIPAGIGAALPLSVQTLTSATASLFGGTIVERLGTKKILVLSFVLQVAGYVVCAMNIGYFGILLGMFLVGAGAGFTYVSCNTMVSLADNAESVEKGYADVSAGVLSGCTVGVGMGALVLSIANVNVVYISAAVFSGIALLICFNAKNRTGEKRKKEKVNVFRFFSNRTVYGYFLFLLVPYMICIAFKDYFFPTYVEPLGIDEVRIGQINLLIGLSMLYIGPPLAIHVIGQLKEKGSVIAASVIVAIGMALFVIAPGVPTAIIGLVMFYLSSSFAFTCQYSYFGKLPVVSEFGEGNAMGVYSMFENLGQTAGPLLFGAVLAAGYREGIMIIGISLILLVILFIVSGLKRKQTGEKQ